MTDRYSKPRLLIVDDDLDFVSDLSIMLSSEFEIISSSNTNDAQSKYVTHRPDCILVDLQMPQYFGTNPDREGLSLINHIRTDPGFTAAADVPIIIISAFADSEKIGRLKELGVSTVYSKPPDIKKLKTAIWDLVTRKGHPTS